MSNGKNSKNSNPLNSGSQNGKGKNSPKFHWWIYVVIILALLGINVYFMGGSSGNHIKYSKFLNYVRQGYIKQITIKNGTNITGVYSQKAINKGIAKQNKSNNGWSLTGSEPSKHFNTTMLKGDDIRPILDKHNVAYDVQISSDWFSSILVWLIPIGLAIAFWIFIFRKMNPGQQVLNIGKNKASLYDKQKENEVSFKDVAGLDEAKSEVEEIVQFLKTPEKFTKLGGELPKGVLLVGPPGTGKTLLAKATAGEADVPFYSLSGSDFVEMFVGVGAARVRDLFKQAKEQAPCIVFIDEIDAIGQSRGRGMMVGSNDERENTLNQLLNEMDGFDSNKGVIIMAATNRPDVLDSALLRPGRFDRQIVIDKPDLNGRVEVLKVHTRDIILSDNIDLKLLASQTPGFAGAELANLCNEAALTAARRGKDQVEMVDFQDSIERVIAGLEKKNKIISPHERKIVAYHEAGHAIVGWYLKYTDPVLKVSIVPRGLAALGFTLQTPLEDRFLMTTDELNEKICALLGGRVAEEIIFGRISTGAQNDLERVTNMAFAMVAEYGMSDELGYVSLKDSKNPDNSYGFNKKYSEQTAERIDKAVNGIIDKNHERTKELLSEHKDQLEELAQTLLEKEVLDHNDLKKLLGDHPEGKYPDNIFDQSLTKNKVNGHSDKVKEDDSSKDEEKAKEQEEQQQSSSDSSDSEENISEKKEVS
ncbi:MAG TPA: ATP-dependent zinc metalloprotease FtsH [Balneolaceae bacterium]|nr:ATP-dependent zinc metalloprotease FtsH [Balneolaceae bacterium]